MKTNMGAADRIIRLLLVAVVIVLYWTGAISGTIAIVLGVVAAIFLITSIIGFCPAYTPLGISTRSKHST
jgi:Inner membrane protein YgaP-like, transmembrane domain